MPKVQAWLASKNSTCTLENAAVRREWYLSLYPYLVSRFLANIIYRRSDLSIPEREDYIKAVLCLQKKPAKVPSNIAPGAKSRFDDFVAFHMTQAMMLHDTTHLFASHRYFIWAYEKALREECGYKGYQPVSTTDLPFLSGRRLTMTTQYMNYDRYAQDPINSPMFNGKLTQQSLARSTSSSLPCPSQEMPQAWEATVHPPNIAGFSCPSNVHTISSQAQAAEGA